MLQKNRPEIQSKSFLVAMIKMETKTGLSITSQLLKKRNCFNITQYSFFVKWKLCYNRLMFAFLL